MEWEDRRDRGDPVAPEVLCPDDTLLRTALTERIRLIEEFRRRFLASEDAPRPARVEPLPERIGKYEIRGRLGEGGMGIVFLGHDAALDRPVAVKIIRPEKFAFAPAQLKDRFAREGQALAQLAHPNVVAVYESGWHNGSPYLAMEYVPGGTLCEARDRLTRAGPLSVAALVEKVARAVAFAHSHEKRVFHRDLKPANILLTTTGEPKVADFGLAKLLDPEARGAGAPVTIGPTGQTTVGVGTPAYMAPEQSDPARGPIAATTDVWALGVILHELLTGVRPVPGVPPDPEAVAKVVPGRVGRNLAAIVERCLRSAPGERYQSAGALADALGAVRAPSRRRALAIGAALLLGLCGAGVYLFGSKPKNEEIAPRVDPELEGFTNPDFVSKALEKLESGQPVTLIDDDTAGSWRLTLGPASGRVTSDRKLGFRVHSREVCFLELLPRLPPGKWIIEGRLQHEHAFRVDGGGGASPVGVACAISRNLDPTGWRALALAGAVTYADPQATFPAVTASVRLVNAAEPNHDHNPEAYHLLTVAPLPPPQGGLRGIPFEIAVHVSGAGVIGRVDQKTFPSHSIDSIEVGRRQVQHQVQLKWKNPTGLPAHVNMYGGVGLYVIRGILRVERFVVRPE
jgi:serine/threonine protein kinase